MVIQVLYLVNIVKVTIEELVDELVEQMDIVYDFVIHGIDIEDYVNDDYELREQFDRAKSLFNGEDNRCSSCWSS